MYGNSRKLTGKAVVITAFKGCYREWGMRRNIR